MPFPSAPRVIYSKSPLEQVICQLRFPAILSIDTTIPAGFQERVRNRFPNYSEQVEITIDATNMSGTQAPNFVKQLVQSQPIKNYEFSSEDGNWKINLTRSFVALTSKRYERWEVFREHLQVPIDALLSEYAPSHFSRIGLRYIDVIRRSSLGLGNAGWDELLQPYVLGMLSSGDVRDQMQSFDCKFDIRLSDNISIVRILTRFAEESPGGEFGFVIDSDFFNSNNSLPAEIQEKLEFFRVRGTRLFQWCITDKLHLAMEPRNI